MKIFTTILVIFSLTIINVIGQDKVSITSTNLKVTLKEGYSIDETSATILSQELAISFIEMAGVAFDSQDEDFNDIEAKYLQKGIVVNKHERGRISKYGALFTSLNTKPAVYQIFFGDSTFCAIANVIAIDSSQSINEEELHSILNTIEYVEGEESALDVHANFIIAKENTEWDFISYTGGMFGFENKTTNDALIIQQFPPSTLLFYSEEDFANKFVERLQKDIPDLEIKEEGIWKAKNIKGYRVLLSSSSSKRKLFYLFIFSSTKSVFVFQGIGDKSDSLTQNKYDSFLDDLSLKKENH